MPEELRPLLQHADYRENEQLVHDLDDVGPQARLVTARSQRPTVPGRPAQCPAERLAPRVGGRSISGELHRWVAQSLSGRAWRETHAAIGAAATIERGLAL